MTQPTSGERSGSPRPRLLLNFWLMLVSGLAGQAVALVMGLHLARTLGVSGFAVWVFATSIIAQLLVVVDGGTEAWGTREISAHPNRLRQALGTITRLRLALLAATLGVVAVVAAGSDPQQRWALAFGTTSLAALAVAPVWAHRGLESPAPAVATLVQKLAMLILVVVLVRQSADAPSVMLWQGLTELVAAGVLMLLLAPHLRRPATQVHSSLADLWRASWPLGLSRTIRFLPVTTATLVLGFASSEAEVSHFGAALRIAVLVVVVGGVFTLTTFPTLARASLAGPEAEGRIIEPLQRLLSLILAPIAVGGIALATPLINLLLTQRYAQASTALQLLLAAYLFVGVTDNLRRVLQARHQQNLDLRIVIFATVAAVACSLVLAPAAGAAGAAIAVLIGELVLVALTLRAIARTGPAAPLASAMAFPLGASLVMGGAVAVTQAEPLAARILVGVVVYLAILLLWRKLIMADIHQLRSANGEPQNA